MAAPRPARAGLVLAAFATAAAGAEAQPSLRPYRWRRLPTATIRPKGWLEQQARLQADALTSHLPLFWPLVADTPWLGGNSTAPAVDESAPYWLNGAVPLALQLGDASLLAVTERYIDGILKRQKPDGWLGPDATPSDYWSRFPFILALVQYHEASPVGSEVRQRVRDASLAFFGCVAGRLAKGIWQQDWSWARVHDLVWAIHYWVDVLEATPEDASAPAAGLPGAQELLVLATMLHYLGFDWHSWFGNESSFATGPVPAAKATMITHGVNNAQAIKHGAVWARQTTDLDPKATIERSHLAWEMLMRYHGLPSGVFSADEHLAGTSPSRGTELCAVVEAMWSLALLAQASTDDGDAAKALDALEQLAVNALPGSLSGDLWSHPYLSFMNGYQALPNTTDHTWATDGPDSAMYGLAPQFECCTANFHQGYPKLITGLFYEVPEKNALVSALWLPSHLNSSSDIGGGASVELRTEYPFGLSAEYLISNPKAFQLQIRLPAFLREVAGPDAGLATVRVWVEGHERVVELEDGFVNFEIPAWPLPEPRVAVRLEWRAAPRVRQAPAGSGQGASVFVGPLLLAPDLGERRTAVKHYAFEATDWSTVATKPWAYALPKEANLGQPVRRGIGPQPFGHGPERCPLLASAQLLKLESWAVAHNAPGPLPPPEQLRGAIENVTLLPYGCTSLRTAALPEVPMTASHLATLPNVILA